MRYSKMLGLLAVAAASLMVFAGVASATQVTSPANTTYTSTIKAESEGSTTLHNTSLGVSITCTGSSFEGKVEAHGAGVTAGGKLNALTLTQCGTNDTTVLRPGSLEIHALGNGNGTVTSSGMELTFLTTSVGISCLYKTGSTDIGTLTGSKSTGKTAVLDVSSAILPRTGDSVFCGSSATWTGSFRVTTPDYLDVD